MRSPWLYQICFFYFSMTTSKLSSSTIMESVWIQGLLRHTRAHLPSLISIQLRIPKFCILHKCELCAAKLRRGMFRWKKWDEYHIITKEYYLIKLNWAYFMLKHSINRTHCVRIVHLYMLIIHPDHEHNPLFLWRIWMRNSFG